jgi:hypothetical protein
MRESVGVEGASATGRARGARSRVAVPDHAWTASLPT